MRFWWFLIISTAVALLRFVDEFSASGPANSSDAPAAAPGGAPGADPRTGTSGKAIPSSAPAEDVGKNDENGSGGGKEEGGDEDDDGSENASKGDDEEGGGDDMAVDGSGVNAEGNDKGEEGSGDTGDEDGEDDEGKEDDNGDDVGKGDKKDGEYNNGADDSNSGDGNNSPSRGDWPYHYRKRCQDVHGNFRPLATICTNELEDEICTIMFPPDKDNPHARPRKCDLIGVNCLALKCAKHCKICCELAAYGCGDNPGDNEPQELCIESSVSCSRSEMRVNCVARKDDCDAMPTAMRIACAGTCGLCNKGGCRDNMDGCIALRSVCREDVLRDDMAKKCSRSCGFCDSKCRDTGLNCKAGKMRGDCFRKGYRQMMKEVCTDTCGYCTNRQFSAMGGGAGDAGGGSLLDYVGGSRGQNKRRKVAEINLST